MLIFFTPPPANLKFSRLSQTRPNCLLTKPNVGFIMFVVVGEKEEIGDGQMKSIKSQANGKTVEYRIYEYLNDIICNVLVDGKPYTTAKPEAKVEVQQGRQVYGHIGKVFVSKPDLWNEIWTAYMEAKARLESSDEYKVKQLRQQREKLARELQYSISELSESEQRQVEAAMQGRSYRYNADALQAAIDNAQSALDAFDAAQPEVIAGLRKERDECTERNMWN